VEAEGEANDEFAPTTPDNESIVFSSENVNLERLTVTSEELSSREDD
jgi:hypothetical protein